MTYRKRTYGRFPITWRRMALVLLFSVLAGTAAHADEPQVTSQRWVIVLTITDRVTGTPVEQDPLQIDLTFDDLGDCQSFLDQVGPIPSTNYFAAVLTCREVEKKGTAI
jgi:hypothetical protein